MKLWHQVTIGLIAGVIFGLLAGEKTIYVKPIGDIFINLIKMVIVPLVFFAIISGITSVSDSRSLGRIGVKSSIAFLSTTAFAICIGLATAILIKPGEGINLDITALAAGKVESAVKLPEQFSLTKLLLSVVPTNAIGAMAAGEMLQVVFFAIFTGVTLITMGNQAKPIIELSQHMAKVVFKMISIIIKLSPYGAFALTAWVVGNQGVEVLISLGKLVGCVIFAMFLQYLIFGLLISVFAGMSPMPFYKKSFEYQTLAFSTSSSKATLATTMKVCQNKLGISNSSTSFILPLGASINMDGMAIYLGMCAVFFAQATGTDLSIDDYFMIMLTATLGSIGGAGIPGGSMVMLPMVLVSVGLPIEGVALIAGVDRILDMMRTTINITGDATITLIIDKSEGTLDLKKYYS